MKNRFIAKSIVRAPDGSLDKAATAVKYEQLLLKAYDDELVAAEKTAKAAFDKNLGRLDADLDEYMATRAKWDELSATHINAAFARFAHSTKGGCIAKSTLVSMVTSEMLTKGEVGINDVKKAGEMVLAYIDDNKGTIFEIAPGPAGGVRLIKSDAPRA